MNVLIINPPWQVKNGYGCRSNTRWPHIRKDKYLHFPIYLAYAAALVRQKGIAVDVLDAVASDLSDETFITFIQSKKTDICFIETSTPTIDEDIRNACAIKKTTSSAVYLMGPHVSFFHKEIIQQHPMLDGIIRGEFEITISELSSGMQKKDVAGLTYFKEGNLAVNSDRALIDNLDAVPFPARDLFNMKHYESHLYRSPSFLMITSRGCPYNCSFCLWPDVMYGHTQRYRSASNVCDEMEYLINTYGAREIRFDDDTFALNKNHVLALCDEIKKRNIHKKITWTCFGHISQHDESMYTALKESGCFKIDFGVESGSDSVLKRTGKSIDIAKAKKTVDICKKAGLIVYCDFMIGFPEETKEDIEKSISAAFELNPDYIQISYVIPYPGTRMYAEELKKNTLLYPTQWEQYASCGPLIKNQNLSEQELTDLYNAFWRKFYLRPSYILKTGIRMLKSPSEFKRYINGFISFAKRFLIF